MNSFPTFDFFNHGLCISLSRKNIYTECESCDSIDWNTLMNSNPGVAAKMFESLYNEGVNINMISTSEIRVTVLINEKDGVRAMNAVHDAFNLAD